MSTPFKNFLNSKGISAKKLAKKAGINPGTLSRIINGHTKKPSKEVSGKIAQALDIRVYELEQLLEITEEGTWQSEFNKYLREWIADSKLVYSAPACAFLSGEHAVVFGHPAVYLPLPLRLYIKLEASSQFEGIYIDEFKCPHPNKKLTNSIIADTDTISHYRSRNCSTAGQQESLLSIFESVINPFLKSEFRGVGFRICVLSSYPIAVGLNSSGALSACIAEALTDHFIDIEKLKLYFELTSRTRQEVAMLLAWAIENCFHGGCSSGAGATISFNGRLGRHPILYSISKRSYLSYKCSTGWNSVSVSESEQGFRTLSNIKRFIFDPGANVENLPDYPNPPNYNVTILYSGTPSRTEAVLNRDIRSYIKESKERVDHVCKLFDKTFKLEDVQRTLAVHRYDIIEKIYLNDQFDGDKSSQMAHAYFELLSEALGSISIAIFNSIVANWSSTPDLMNSYQALLCGMNLSTPKIESLINRIKYMSMDEETYDKQTSSSLGLKITGAGIGGDVLALSLLSKDTHENLINNIKKGGHVVHFDSCSLSSQDWNSPVDGVRQEKI